MLEVKSKDYMEIDALEYKAKLSEFIFKLRRVGERINFIVSGLRALDYLKKSVYFNPTDPTDDPIGYGDCEFCGTWKSGYLLKDSSLEEDKALFVLEDCYQKIRIVELTIKNLPQ